MQSLKWI